LVFFKKITCSVNPFTFLPNSLAKGAIVLMA
jgi:hypothetical protein